MGYKILGYAVWHGAKWYLNRRFARSQRLAAAGVVGVAIVALVVAGGRRASSSS
jgi:hypothetical protein